MTDFRPELKLIQGGLAPEKDLEGRMREYEKQTILNMIVPGRLYREIQRRRTTENRVLSKQDIIGLGQYFVLQGMMYTGAAYYVYKLYSFFK